MSRGALPGALWGWRGVEITAAKEEHWVTTIAEVNSGNEALCADQCTRIHQLMVRARVLDERMIQMSKSGEGYFWIGGPGEEAFNVCLGLQLKKGCGPDYDFLHLHYRSLATLLAMGMPMLDATRQAAVRVTDPHSMGRNFLGHSALRKWNVVPVSSVVGAKFAMAPGTALVQKRRGGDGVTVVVGGDAGSSEGDFATCMIWSTRPGQELPVLMIVMNNQWGISTPMRSQHSEQHIVDRGEPFGIPGEVVDGNDPIASWHALRRALQWCRRKRRPFMLEPQVSRLHGHSSSSGAVRVENEPDCLELWEAKLLAAGLLTRASIDELWEVARGEAAAAVQQALQEPEPTPDDVRRHTYAASPVDVVYPDDYTGLPH